MQIQKNNLIYKKRKQNNTKKRSVFKKVRNSFTRLFSKKNNRFKKNNTTYTRYKSNYKNSFNKKRRWYKKLSNKLGVTKLNKKNNSVNKRRLNINNQINYTSNVYWIRHATSCNNILTDFEKILKRFTDKKRISNPSIIKEAITGSCYVGSKMQYEINPSIVFCSNLLRSIQTAILMFPNHFIQNKIKIIPGIGEIGMTGNIPSKKEETIILINDWINYLKEQIDASYLPLDVSENCKKMLSRDFGEIENINKLFNFYDYFEMKNNITSRFLPEKNIIHYIINFLKEKKILTDDIAIVSHSNYIKKYIFDKDLRGINKNLLTKKGKLKNNQILHKRYTMNLNNKIIKSENSLILSGCFISNYNGEDLFQCVYKQDHKTINYIKDASKRICKKNY